MTDGQFIERATLDLWAETQQEQRDTITALRAQLAEAQQERDDAMALFHTSEKTWKARVDRAEAALAAQIEADAELCAALYRMALRDSDNDLSSPWKSHKASAYGTALQAIRSQPHDRTALDRLLAEAREKALREAILEGMRIATFTPIEQVHAAIDDAILALIEAPDAQP